jgi:hypothetical protein
MDQLNGWGLGHASEQQRNRTARHIVDQAFQAIRSDLVAAISSFIANPINPANFYAFETMRLSITRQFG